MSRVIIRIAALVIAVVSLAGVIPPTSDERFVEPAIALQPVFRVERATPPAAKAPLQQVRFPVAIRRTTTLSALRSAPALPATEAVAPLPFIAGDGPPMRGTRIAQTGRLDVYVGLRTFTPEQVAAIAPRLEELLRGSEERFGFQLQQRVSIAFYRPSLAPSKDTRGIAYTEEGRAEVYYRPNEDIERALVVASHELAHHLQAQRYGYDAQKRADIILLEGLATWITGSPWLAKYEVASWRERARQIGDSGVPLRLLRARRYGDNIAYELWASFVDFLIERDGMEKMHALYVSGRGREPGSADYQGVYGASLTELANEWREWVRGQE